MCLYTKHFFYRHTDLLNEISTRERENVDLNSIAIHLLSTHK